MMSREKTKAKERILAMLLAVLMLVSMLPSASRTALAVDPEVTVYTLTVTELSANAEPEADPTPIVGATVKFVVEGIDEGTSVTTDENGVAEYLGLQSELQDQTLEYTVTKDGYVEETGSVVLDADNFGGSATVELTEVIKKTVTVNVTGEATVKLNGVEQKELAIAVGTKIPVEITAAEGFYITELTVGNESQTLEDKQKSFEIAELEVNDDIKINVALIEEFTVSVNANVGFGTVKLDEQEIDNEFTGLIVDDGTEVLLSVTPATDYFISSIKINKLEQQISNNLETFEKTITVLSDCTIEVVFEKIKYDVTITWNETDGYGSVVATPSIEESENGTVTVETGSEITINATPNEGYRVSSLKIDGVEALDADSKTLIQGVNDEKVSDFKYSINKATTIEIKFAPNVYKITLNDEVGGKAQISSDTVEHGKDCKVTLVPETSYTVHNVYINGTNKTKEITFIEDEKTGERYFIISSVEESLTVTVTFKTISEGKTEDISVDSTADLRTDSDVYVIKNGTSIVFSTKKSGIALYDDKNELIAGAKDVQKVEINSNKTVKTIKLYYQDTEEHYPEWHVVSFGAVIVIDATDPQADLKAEREPNEQGYYNSDIDINVSAYDIDCSENDITDDRSGIETVEYWIRLNGEDGDKTSVTPTDALEKLEFSISVDANINNSENVVVCVSVIDKAGNDGVFEYPININSTPPEIYLDISGEKNENAAEGAFYDGDRTITITIKDREDTFLLENVLSGLKIFKDGNDEPIVLTAQSISYSNPNGDSNTHVIEYTFNEDGEYTWSVSYTNEADMSNDGYKECPTDKDIFAFTVDKTPPSDLKITYIPDFIGTILENITFGFYDAEVEVRIEAEDATSGIQNFKYSYIVQSGASSVNVGKSDVPSESIYPVIENEKGYYTTFKIPPQFRGYVSFTVWDNAGNKCYISHDEPDKQYVIVDTIAPEIDVEFDNNDVRNEKYFNEYRTATIKIIEANFFDGCVDVTVESSVELDVDYAELLSKKENWQYVGDDQYEATIEFDKEAHYKFNISCTDKSGNTNNGVTYSADSKAVNEFTIDTTAPTELNISINELNVNAKDTFAFDTFYRNEIAVKLDANFDISGENNIKYQKVDMLSKFDINGTWSEYDKDNGIVVSPSEKFIIFFRAEDNAGNVTIINSTGIIVDDKNPSGDNYAPELGITLAEPNTNGYYNGDVTVDFEVVDPKYLGEAKDDNGYYSGIQKITYEISATDLGEEAIETGVLYDITATDSIVLDDGYLSEEVTDADGLTSSWTGRIVINKTRFNSNNVIVKITAKDNAGNEITSQTKLGDIKIDITAPEIEVTYDNNTPDSGKYFKADRTAKVVVTERNFDKNTINDYIKFVIVDTHGTVPVISEWTVTDGTGNQDDRTWTAKIVYNVDGDYTFGLDSCKDLADNECTEIDFKDSVVPTEFTIDKTIPTVGVAYDNNSAANGIYYNADRTATITIVEHNFDASRVTIIGAASDDGKTTTFPTATQWKTNGDVHTATISYTVDSRYTFDIEIIDLAGNSIKDFETETFYVDKTNPVLTITGIVDESANKDSGDIGYIITSTDTNFDKFVPVLNAVMMKEDNTFETKTLDVGRIEEIKNGKRFIVTNLDADGIYSIQCTVVDKAGNKFSEVILENADGNTYVEKRSGNDTLVQFSVNRKGSTFLVNEFTDKLIKDFYVKNANENIVITEINADELLENTVSLNGKELELNKDYVVEEESSAGGWKKYNYSISKDLFANEGEYNIIISSKDKADNAAFSDVKGATVNFVVDRTAPVVTVTGLTSNGRYQTDSQKVTLIPTDDGGALSTLIVRLVDEDGELVEELINLAGETLDKALTDGNGMITFEIGEGLYQNVQIICTDSAVGGEEANVYNKTFKNVSVSSNAFMIFWANKPLRWGVIAGFAALIAIVVVIIVVLKKRKKKTTTK